MNSVDRRTMRLGAIATASMLALGGAALAADAPGAPGAASVWSYAGKTGIGTSYEAYVDGKYADGGKTGAVSKVWFSLAKGVVTETMYGLIHEAQIRELQFAVVGDGWTASETADTTSTTAYLHTDAQGRPLSPAYKVVNRDKQGRFEIEKHVFTDPDRNTLFMRVVVRPLKGAITPHLMLDPSVGNTGGGDRGDASNTALHAYEGGAHLTLAGSAPFAKASVGFSGVSDGWTDLKDGKMDWAYASSGADAGNIVLTGQLPTIAKATTYDFALGFGPDAAASAAAANGSLKTGYKTVLANYNGQGAAVGWEDYIASLSALPGLAKEAGDGGKLAYASALMLKVQEDKTHAGALIASLSNPWGETVDAAEGSTGYKAVWPRDFYQCAMALAALGDRATPVAAFRYLPTVQVGAQTPGNKGAGGWFLQKSHVDGTPEWMSVQLDQTAMPIMLGWKLWKNGLMSEAELKGFYASMLKPAADFLTDGGKLDIDWNKETITPPYTQQERWEEQPGHSPSTTAAVIAGLVTAADIAKLAGDTASADRYLKAADADAAKVEARMFTTNGPFGDGKYFIRTNLNEDPNDHAPINDRNGRPGAPEDQVLDAGFLELVRYGVRRADDPHITGSLPELDDEAIPELLRVRYSFKTADGRNVDGWRRYGNDGYGEGVETGKGFAGNGQEQRSDQRGRVWPFFTGERGHYELAAATLRGDKDAKAKVRDRYVKGMEFFANGGLMISEQVFDGVGNNAYGYEKGQGTNSATPLAWSHAEYVKLLRSVHDGKVWDFYEPVAARYAK